MNNLLGIAGVSILISLAACSSSETPSDDGAPNPSTGGTGGSDSGGGTGGLPGYGGEGGYVDIGGEGGIGNNGGGGAGNNGGGGAGNSGGEGRCVNCAEGFGTDLPLCENSQIVADALYACLFGCGSECQETPISAWDEGCDNCANVFCDNYEVLDCFLDRN